MTPFQTDPTAWADNSVFVRDLHPEAEQYKQSRLGEKTCLWITVTSIPGFPPTAEVSNVDDYTLAAPREIVGNLLEEARLCCTTDGIVCERAGADVRELLRLTPRLRLVRQRCAPWPEEKLARDYRWKKEALGPHVQWFGICYPEGIMLWRLPDGIAGVASLPHTYGNWLPRETVATLLAQAEKSAA